MAGREELLAAVEAMLGRSGAVPDLLRNGARAGHARRGSATRPA